MSFTTWTPTEVASNAFPCNTIIWRAVEAQHSVATMNLVDNLDEQFLLEQLLEDSKPLVSATSKNLHWLLFTPFRYPPLPSGSRFRGPSDPGVFYGASAVRTACAELGYWRWRFLIESPALKMIDSKPQSVFSAGIDTVAIDLRNKPFDKDRDAWMAFSNYEFCQTMARVARAANVGAIHYQSVRDPKRECCTAVLTPDAFESVQPLELQSWSLSIHRERVLWRRSDPLFDKEAFEFAAADWVKNQV